MQIFFTVALELLQDDYFFLLPGYSYDCALFLLESVES